MDEQPVQPTDPVTPAEQTTPPATEAPVEPAVTKTPEQEFMDAYKALCEEKGFELAFEVKPAFDGKIYDLSKVSIVYSVAKTK